MCTAAKVFESLLLPRLRRLLEPTLVEEQFGFRYGADEAVACFAETTSRRRHLGLPTWCAFLDVTKAYDTVWREALFCELHRRGLQGRTWALRWGTYAGATSGLPPEAPLPPCVWPDGAGVRQGSLLSPLLFNVFIDGLARKMRAA